MLVRYTRPEMAQLWLREETKYECWLSIEVAFLSARAKHGDIGAEVPDLVMRNAKIDLTRMKEIEDEVGHDMIAFVKMIQESLVAAGLGQYKERFHELLTSYNTEDPAMVLMLRAALDYILDEMTKLKEALVARAFEHKHTYMIMRTHGQFAEPSTFGHLLLVFASALGRSLSRIEHCLETELIHGNISGAVGSYGEIDPALEEAALAEVGLRPARAETQILQRDRHAEVLSVLAIAASSIEQMMRTFWEMCRSDVGELQEPRKKKQRGSSAMAHKKNPIGIEQLMGLPRLLRGYAHAAMENIATPEGRDISQSSVERHIFPDATSLLHYMAYRATKIVEGLVVFPERMKHNLMIQTHGTWAGQPVRTALMRAGVDYDTAYEYVQTASFQAIDRGIDLSICLSDLPLSEADARNGLGILGPEIMAKCFDPAEYVGRGIEHIFSQFTA